MKTRIDRGEIAGNEATGWLKLLALAFMFCDHAGKMLLPSLPVLRQVGRLAFPLYCWCMVVGVCRTRSIPKYMLRILLVGVISQPLYMWGLDHTWKEPNIFFTLAAALGALWGIRKKWWGSHVWAPALALVMAVALNLNYGWKGVLLVLLLYAVRDSRAGIAAVMVAFCLYWGQGSSTVTNVLGIGMRWIPAPFSALTAPFMKLQALAVLSLPLLLVRFPRDVRLPAWVGYGIYPAHLLLLIALEKLPELFK